MRSLASAFFVLCLIFAAPVHANQAPKTQLPASTAEELKRLSHLADVAHKNGDVEAEIEYRRRYSQMAWAAGGPKLEKRSVYWWGLIDENDLPLAILLEGTQKWSEAEALFRHNQQELAHDPVAGNDIKSDNELLLAHLLAREGKPKESRKICAHWEKRVRHNADFAVYAVKYDVPRPPLYDSPEAEVGAWDLACGRPDQGTKLLREQMAAHPDMLTPYTFLSHYYFAEGNFKDGLKTEAAALLNGPTVNIEVLRSETELH